MITRLQRYDMNSHAQPEKLCNAPTSLHCTQAYKLTGHVHCIGWQLLGIAQPCIQPCLHVNPSYRT